MQEEHRKAIQNNFCSLVEQTHLDSLVAALYEKNVFSEAMIEPYKDSSKDLRSRKRLLYRDIERRGPQAFANLVEALTETGHWDLVRALEPNNALHPCKPTISLRATRVKSKTFPGNREPLTELNPYVPYVEPPTLSPPPSFQVVKSLKFHEDTDAKISSYTTRSRKRGILLMITNIEFKNNIEEYRRGADVDQRNLKELFNEIGFHKILSYNNLPKDKMNETIKQFSQLTELEVTECVFVIIASHGHERLSSGDTDIRCSDGGLVPAQSIVEQFNNVNCPKLHNVPKVFIFQTCRGSNADSRVLPTRMHFSLPPPSLHAEVDGAPRQPQHRLYSDIVIANSTLPGYVSHRDPMEGSWYIQALCRVFAERAHDCHVEELFTLVDIYLERHFHTQTSSVDRWGFNKCLYLHPGLFQD